MTPSWRTLSNAKHSGRTRIVRLGPRYSGRTNAQFREQFVLLKVTRSDASAERRHIGPRCYLTRPLFNCESVTKYPALFRDAATAAAHDAADITSKTFPKNLPPVGAKLGSRERPSPNVSIRVDDTLTRSDMDYRAVETRFSKCSPLPVFLSQHAIMGLLLQLKMRLTVRATLQFHVEMLSQKPNRIPLVT